MICVLHNVWLTLFQRNSPLQPAVTAGPMRHCRSKNCRSSTHMAPNTNLSFSIWQLSSALCAAAKVNDSTTCAANLVCIRPANSHTRQALPAHQLLAKTIQNGYGSRPHALHMQARKISSASAYVLWQQQHSKSWLHHRQLQHCQPGSPRGVMLSHAGEMRSELLCTYVTHVRPQTA